MGRTVPGKKTSSHVHISARKRFSSPQKIHTRLEITSAQENDASSDYWLVFSSLQQIPQLLRRFEEDARTKSKQIAAVEAYL